MNHPENMPQPSCLDGWLETLRKEGGVSEYALPGIPDPAPLFRFERSEGGNPASDELSSFPLFQWACIEVSGADARDFLSRQLTNDLKTVGVGQAQFSAWCTAQGRVIANFLVYPACAAGDVFRLALSAELLPFVIKRLQKYILRSDVRLLDLSETHGFLGLSGVQAADALEKRGFPVPEKPAQTQDASEIRLNVSFKENVQAICLPDGRLILSSPFSSLPDLWRQFGARLAGQSFWEWQDIQSALPWITHACTELFVPQMMDFDKIGGVSFTKGCYPGQEIVARTRYLGGVKRHLYRICASPFALKPGEALYSPAASSGQSAGSVIIGASSPEGYHEALAVVLASCADDLHYGKPDGALLKAVQIYK